MSLSRTMDRKGSKVLKVALSAALAAAFTPIAAAPAFAKSLTADEQAAVSTAVTGADYASAVFATSANSFVAGYTATQVTAENNGLTSDMATFVNALGTGVNSITYKGKAYTKASEDDSWTTGDDGAKSLNAAVADDLKAALVKDGKVVSSSAGASFALSAGTDSGTTTVNLTVQVSRAQVYDDKGQAAGAETDLKSALDAARSGYTVRMLSNTVTKEQLSLPAGVTLEGNGYTITRRSTTGNDAAQNGVIVLSSDDASAKDATIRNLRIDGPNTVNGEKQSDGTVEPQWTEGEYAVKAYGASAKLTVENLQVANAQSAMQANAGAVLTVKGSLRLSNLEYGGIEVSESANSKLVLDSTASITYAETADTPFAWVDGAGTIENNTKTSLTKVKASDTKAHYYLNSSDKNGAHFYTAVSDKLGTDALSASNVLIGSEKECALVKFVPSTSATYCFASTGTVDAAAELYTATAEGGLGTKIAQGDDEQGYSFRVFAKLTAGNTYILRVSSFDSNANINLTAEKADAASLDSYTVSLPNNIDYYNDDKITATKLKATVKSGIDGRILSADKYTCTIYRADDDGNRDGDALSGEITAYGRYILEVTPKASSGLAADSSAFCYFYVNDAANIADYDFKYNKTLVLNSNQAASITALAPKGYRYSSSTLAFDESNVKVMGWYTADKNGEPDKQLGNAPSAVGSYILELSPTGKTTAGKDGGFNTNTTVDLPFSITRGRVSVPSARTGLSYTGSAQVGVPTGANYTLSGTYQATNAGTYSCTATLAEGYSWSDGTTAPKTLTWSIARARVSVPSGNSVSYTGKAQVGVSPGAGYTLSGTTSATEPGDYTCTATPTANYAWSDGTTTSKSIKWTLAKAAAGITATPASVVVDRGGRATVALKQAGTASYTVSTSDATVATATVAGSGVSISANASGTATITVSTAATARYAAGSATISVSVPKAEGDTGSAKVTTVAADGTSTTVTNRYRVTSEAYAADPDATPTVAFTGTSAKSGRVAVPASVTLADGVTYKVTSVAARALKGKRVAAVELPASVTAIGKQAFASTPKLKSLVLGKKVKSVGKQALKGSAAKTVTLKTSKLSKASVKNLLDGSKLTTVKCAGVSKKAKASYKKWVKIYKKGVKFK